MVRLYAASLRLEAQEIEQLIAAAENRRDQVQKAARELYSYEVREEVLKNNLDQSRDLLRTIVKRMQEMTLIKEQGGRP
jgi:hypothetical protein